MRVLSFVNRMCYVVCVLSIVFGATLSIFSIWSDFNNDLMWKGISTALVLFAAGVLTIGVNNIIGTRVVLESGWAGPDGPLAAKGELTGTPGGGGGGRDA